MMQYWGAPAVRRSLRFACSLTVSVIVALPLRSQSVAIRAVLLDSLSRPVVSADVIITNTVTREFVRGTSDSAGRVSLRLNEALNRELIVFASQLQGGVRRVIVVPTDTIISVSIVMPAGVSQLLQRVTVSAPQVQPPIPPDRGSSWVRTGGGERLVTTVRGALSPNDQGNLAALAQLEGNLASVGGNLYSLGAGGDQVVFSSDGLGIGSARVPRESRTAVTVMTSPFDINAGGFAGVMVNATPAPASKDYNTSGVSLYTASAESQRISAARTGGAIGPQVGISYGATRTWADRIGVNASIDGQLQSAEAPVSASELLSRPDCDECALVRGASSTNGVDVVAPSISPRSYNLLGLLRFDHIKGRQLPLTLILTGEAANTPVFQPAFANEALSRRNRLLAGSAQLQWRAYSPNRRWVVDVRGGGRHTSASQQPVTIAPQVQVLLNDAAFGRVVVGGSAVPKSHQERTTAEMLVDAQRRLGRGANTIKLLGWLRSDIDREEESPQRLTDVTYLSPSDYDSNRPAVLRVRHSLSEGRIAAVNGALGMANLFEPTSRFRLYAGVRLEASRLLWPMEQNVSTLLPQRTALPSVGLSPRIAIDWMTNGRPKNWTASASPIAASMFVREPEGILRLGFGKFQGRQNTSGLPFQVLSADRQRGAPVSCFAPDIPPLRWSDGEIANDAPSSCPLSDGTDTTTARYAFMPGLAPAASWRATLGYSRSFLGVLVQLDAQWARNVNQPIVENVNFIETPQFVSCADGCRPVFAHPSDIDEATASLSPVRSRRIPTAGDAWIISAARSGGSSATLLVSPFNALKKGNATIKASYTLSRSWREANGFIGATQANPLTRTRVPSPFDARHIIVVQGGFATSRVVMSGLLRVQSGQPFEPVVGSDINGDGLANDRAFIFRPMSRSEEFNEEFTRVIANSPTGVRRCLQAAAGAFVPTGSCRTPWTAISRLRIETRAPLQFAGLPGRTKVGFTIENPVSILASQLRWSRLEAVSTQTRIDPVLLRAVSFSRQNQEFVYAVNRGFAQSVDKFGGLPRVTLDASVDFSRPYEAQLVRRAFEETRRGGIRVGRAAEQIQKAYVDRMTPIFGRLYELLEKRGYPSDSVAALTLIEDEFLVALDSLWSPVTIRVAALSTAEHSTALVEELQAAEQEMWDKVWVPTAARVRARIGPRLTRMLVDDDRFPLEREVGVRRFVYY